MVFRAMLEAKKLSRKDLLMEHLGNEAVRAVFGMYRQVANEAHHYKGFVRFRELKNKTLFAKIEPKHAVLPCIAEHFVDRFPQENWVIYDKTHEVFLIHEKGKRYYFLQQYMCMKEILRVLRILPVDFQKKRWTMRHCGKNLSRASVLQRGRTAHYRIKIFRFVFEQIWWSLVKKNGRIPQILESFLVDFLRKW